MSFTEIESFGRAFVALSVGVLVRSTLLAIFCGALEWILRSRPAEIRHALWRGMLVALFLFPVLQIALPPLRHASPALSRVESALLPRSHLGSVATLRVSPQVTIRTRGPVPSSHPFPWAVMLVGVYLAVAFGFAARLALGLRRVSGIVRRSLLITGVEVRELLQDAWLESGSFINPRVRVSSEVNVPVALEYDSELFILLPDSWRRWDQTKLRVVALHEMCHVKRDDPATTVLSSFATCLFWFHPLSWFLKRRLASLAEEACDEFVLERACTPEQYLHTLAGFAQDVAAQRGRVIKTASAVVHTSRLEKRMEQILAASEIRRKGLGMVRVLAIAAFMPALYLTAAARAGLPQAQNDSATAASQAGKEPWSFPVTVDQAAQLESQLQANPDDLELHCKLLLYYMTQMQEPNYIRELLWIIQHDPGVQFPVTTWVQPQGSPLNMPNDYRRVAAAWNQALLEHPDSANVLFNGGVFFEHGDPERSLELFQQARQLDSSPKSERYLASIARIYVAAVSTDLNPGRIHFAVALTPELAARLRSEFQNSTDPALISEVGMQLVRIGSAPRFGNEALKERGFELLQRAIDLDPANPKWKEALESAKAEPARQRNLQEMTRPAVPPGAIRIGAKVADGNLITKIDPQYPPLALAARIQGTVEFTVTIGPDGHVQNIKLVRGHPLLVQAAVKALQQWIYRPTLLNAQPVAVLTDVAIPFRLPQ